MLGAAVLGGITALVLTLYVILLSGQGHILLGACTTSVSTAPGVSYTNTQVCTPPSPWEWLFPCAAAVGATGGGIWTSLFLRHRIRPLDRAAPPLAPTIFR